MTDANLKPVQLTQEGLDELQAELTELVDIKLPAAVDRVAKAREHGDLAENAEYHSARDDQALLEARIAEIEEVIKRAQVVKHTKSHTVIGIGSKVTVTIKGKKTSQRLINIVGEFEADPGEGKVSAVSPLGKALLTHKKGDEVIVKAPAGEIHYQIDDVQ